MIRGVFDAAGDYLWTCRHHPTTRVLSANTFSTAAAALHHHDYSFSTTWQNVRKSFRLAQAEAYLLQSGATPKS